MLADLLLGAATVDSVITNKLEKWQEITCSETLFFTLQLFVAYFYNIPAPSDDGFVIKRIHNV